MTREHAKAIGRKGGLKGGRVRAALLTSEQRKEIAQRAAIARWGVETRLEEHRRGHSKATT